MSAVLTPTLDVQKGKTLLANGKHYTLYDFESTPKGMYIWVTIDRKRKRWSWQRYIKEVGRLHDFTGEFTSFEDDLAPLLGLLPEVERARVVQRLRDLMELHHGDPWGTLDGPHPANPIREQYDPNLVPVLRDRIRSKTEELRARGEKGVGKSTLYDEYDMIFKPGGLGVVGLIRAPYRKRLNSILDLPDDVKTIARRVAVELAQPESGTVPLSDQIADTTAALADAGYEISKTKARDLVDAASAGLNLRRPGKARQSLAIRPQGRAHRSMQAMFPGHIVQLDTTPLNMFCRTLDGLERMSVDVLTAIDMYSRMVMAIRVVKAPHTAIDVNLLLYDMLGMEFVRATWKTGHDHVWLGLPREIHIPDDGSLRFGMKIKSVVMDLGSQYNNTTTLAALAQQRIRVYFAPPRKATAKGMIESFQLAYSRLTAGLPGDKGRSPDHRGANPKSRVLPTIGHVERLLWEFISSVYNHHRHRKLLDPEARKQKISPIDMVLQHLLTFGITWLPLRPNFRLSFLKEARREIDSEGVWIDGTRFESELDEWEELRAKGNPLHIRYDPRDYTRIYVWHSTRRIWLTIRDYDTFMAYVKVNQQTLAREVRDNEVPRMVHTERETKRLYGKARQTFRREVVADHNEVLAKIEAEKRAAAKNPKVPASPSTPIVVGVPLFLDVDGAFDPELTTASSYVPKQVRR